MGDGLSASATFGTRLRVLRAERGWTLEAVARRLAGVGVDWHPATVSKIERGKRGVSLDDALTLCEALNVTLADMLDADDVQLGGRTLTGDQVRLRCAQYPLDEQWVIEIQRQFMDEAQQQIVDGFLQLLRLVDLRGLQELQRGRVPLPMQHLVDALEALTEHDQSGEDGEQ